MGRRRPIVIHNKRESFTFIPMAHLHSPKSKIETWQAASAEDAAHGTMRPARSAAADVMGANVNIRSMLEFASVCLLSEIVPRVHEHCNPRWRLAKPKPLRVSSMIIIYVGIFPHVSLGTFLTAMRCDRLQFTFCKNSFSFSFFEFASDSEYSK